MPENYGPPIQCSVALKDEPTERILFESFPQAIGESYSARYNEQRGRTSIETFAYYQGGSYGSFSLELTFVAGLHPTINRRFLTGGVSVGGQQVPQTDEVLDTINLETELITMEGKTRWLQALSLPRPSRPRAANVDRRFVLAGDPPRILITIGRFMAIEGVVMSWDTTWKPPFHPVSARPYAATIVLQVKRLGTFYPDWYDMREVAYRRAPSRLSTGATGMFSELESADAPPTPTPVAAPEELG